MDSATNKSIIRKPLFWEAIITFAIVGAINLIATIYHLYWSVAELDSVVHFLGGVATSLFFLWFYFFSGLFNSPKRNLMQFILVSILSTMSISLLWEAHELLLKEMVTQKAQYPFDTILDSVMAFLGAAAACFYGYLKEVESKKAQGAS